MTRSSKTFSLLKNSIDADIFLRVADLSPEINSSMMMPEVNRAVETHRWQITNENHFLSVSSR